MKLIKKWMTADEVYAEWQIPRGMLRAAVESPCPIRMEPVTKNGITRKMYYTSDIVEYFNADMTDRQIEEVEGVGC